ncbi:organic hydroperoxide resistance protein [Vibrio methylphosphonaticus]|uniref:organic hydroperoxide resistance protein n=1 Tax=Vibrio methylphosphonaticus TaxID=2946866 RepID=UPI002029C6D6|nr:organic hydroperoxide resistance protein [Vibrio methylphosphonaticus]MCL9775773.1 organic hydroperoxide resistance protein [Vibrio methylphosphonaticus]
MSALYTTSATALAGRNGQVKTDDGMLDLALSYPKQLGGTGNATNPEQLFAAGYSACFSNAILHVAQQQKIPLKQAPTTAVVALKANENGGFVLDVALDVTLELETSAAVELVKVAHQVCPYSNALRGNVDVKVTANGQAL